MSRARARPRVYLGVAGLIMLVGLGLLLRGALDAAAREQQLRREALAARVFDELEGALAAFVAAEQARPFVQWRREWVASPSAPSLTRSPLAAIPKRDFVLGYFQIEPDGSFASPMLPGPGESTASPNAPAIARVEQLRELNEDLDGGERLALAEPPVQQKSQLAQANNPPPQQQQQQQQQQQAIQQQAVPEDVQIQRALDQQSIARQRKNALANQDSFAPDRDQLSNFLGTANAELATASGDALDVRVTPFVGEPIADSLRLIRTVEIGGQRWIQGLVLDRAKLQAFLEQEVLGSPELAGFVELRWGGAVASDVAAGRWSHGFGPPFAMLSVTAELGRVDRLASTNAKLVLALGIGLALALIAVLVAAERTVSALIERAEERERFVAAVTHELRTPLTSIRMYSEMLEQGMIADPERQRSYHGTIRGEAERLSRLVEQVLTLARLDDRRSVLAEAERAAIGQVVASVVELLEPQAGARGLEIAVELEPACAAIALPRDGLAQILTNLVDNALKFSPEGEGPVEIVGRRVEAGVSLVIRDRGPGVEADVLPRMFEPFVRGRREHEQAVPGTGIGLAVVRALVDELGGRVVGRNREDGQGFAVELVVPVAT